MPDPADPPKSSVVRLDAAEGDGVPTVIGPVKRNSVAESLNLTVGSTLGHFEILAPLGAGGMASVLKARDTQLGRLVALKILPPESAREPDAVARFKHEARAVAKLDHENVARVFFSGEDRGLHFIAFEFVEGETLRARIDRLGRLTPAESVRFLLHCAAGLHHLHERGVVHRDVKPSNVVITPDGRAKLIDLGLARHAEGVSVNGGVTHSGVTLGTFDYISPEQARDPRTADTRADIYSLGCTFYHALTGRPPVPEGNAAVKLAAQQLTAPPDPRELNPDLPDALVRVLNRMLLKDPADRYQTPAELTADLTDVAQALGLTDGTGEVTALGSTALARLAAESPRLPLGWVVAAVVLLAVGLVFASLTGGPSGTVAQPWVEPPPAKPVSPFDGLAKDDPQRNPLAPGPRTVATAEDLIAATRGEVAHVTLQAGKVYDLAETAGLLFSGQKLTVECLDPRTPAVIRVAVSPLPADPLTPRAGGFTVAKADAVTLRNVRFKFVEKAEGDIDETDEPVGVALLDVGKVDMRDCAWDDPDAKAVPSQAVTGLLVGRSGRAKGTEFAARHSYFGARRMTGVEFAGPVTGGFTECGFATAAKAIRLTTDADAATPDPASALELKHCTFLLDLSAVAVQADSVKAAVSAGFCVFAAPAPPDPAAMMMTDRDRKPAALRGTGDTSGVTFAAVPNESSAYFRTDIPSGAAGADSVELTTPPWKTVPPTLDRAEPWKALELNPSVRAIRVSRPAGVHILGATWLPNGSARLYAGWPPGSANAPKPGVKVWYPNPPAAEKGRLPTGVYEDLQQAIDSLRANDVLHVHASGPVKVPAVTLTKGLRVRVQPGDGFNPVLVPAGAGAMFRVEDGELRFEKLHFRLTFPEEAAGTAATVVTLAGGKGVAWTECTLTADETATDSSVMVQVTADRSESRPDVRFEKCLVRGTGRVVRVPAAIPATVAFTNSVVAVGGPVVQLGAPDEKPAEGAAFRVQLAQSTALLAAPLVETTLADAIDALFVPVQIDAEGSLLAPVEKSTGPIVRAVGGDPTAAAKYFQWVTAPGSANRFANFPPTGTFADLPMKRLDSADWLTFTKEKKSALAKMTFALPPSGVAGLPAVTAADLAVTDADPPDEFGAKAGSVPAPPEPAEK